MVLLIMVLYPVDIIYLIALAPPAALIFPFLLFLYFKFNYDALVKYHTNEMIFMLKKTDKRLFIIFTIMFITYFGFVSIFINLEADRHLIIFKIPLVFFARGVIYFFAAYIIDKIVLKKMDRKQ